MFPFQIHPVLTMLTAPTLSKLILLLALGVVIFVSRAHFETSLRGGAVAEKMKETPLLDRGLVGGDVEGMTPTLPPPSPWDTVGEPYYGLGEPYYTASKVWDDQPDEERWDHGVLRDDVHQTFDAVSGARQNITYDGCCTETSWSPVRSASVSFRLPSLIDSIPDPVRACARVYFIHHPSSHRHISQTTARAPPRPFPTHSRPTATNPRPCSSRSSTARSVALTPTLVCKRRTSTSISGAESSRSTAFAGPGNSTSRAPSSTFPLAPR